MQVKTCDALAPMFKKSIMIWFYLKIRLKILMALLTLYGLLEHWVQKTKWGVSTISYHCYGLNLQKNLLLLHKKDHKKLYHDFGRGNIVLSKLLLGWILQEAIKGKVAKWKGYDFSKKIYSELREIKQNGLCVWCLWAQHISKHGKNLASDLHAYQCDMG